MFNSDNIENIVNCPKHMHLELEHLCGLCSQVFIWSEKKRSEEEIKQGINTRTFQLSPKISNLLILTIAPPTYNQDQYTQRQQI